MISLGHAITTGHRLDFLRPPDSNISGISGWKNFVRAAKPVSMWLLFALTCLFTIPALANGNERDSYLSPVPSTSQPVATTLAKISAITIETFTAQVTTPNKLFFHDPSFWQRYWADVVIILVAMVGLGIAVAWVLVLYFRQRRAEEERQRFASLAKSEHQHLDDVVSNVPGVVWETLIDPKTKETRTTFISDYIEKMLGYTPKEWLAAPPGLGLKIMPEEDRELAKRMSDRVLSSGKETTTQFRWQTKDGRTLWVESHLNPIVIDGQIVGMRGVTMDITERKRSEEAKQQTDERNRAILRAIPDLMFLQTADGVYIDYHAKDTSELLLPPGQFLGKNMHEILPPELAERFSTYFKVALDTGEPQLVEYELTLNDVTRWFEARIVATGPDILTVVREVTERTIMEVALRKNEAQYRSIFNAANDAIFVHDAETGEILDANQRMCEMYGYSVAEVKHLTIADLSFNGSAASQAAAFNWVRGAEEGKNQLFEWQAKNKAGESFFVEVGLKHTVIGDRECVLAVVRDITERKRALDELRQSEARFGKAFKANPQPMSITKLADGTYIDVNDSFLAMSGYTRAEVIGRSSLELRIWETPSARADFVSQLKARGSLKNVETKFRIKDGSMRILLSSAEQLEIGGEKCLLVASSDITERMAAQKALRESEERFRNMADTAPVMIWVSDAEKKCTYFNQQWLEFTGRTIDEELGTGWAEGVLSDDLALCLDRFHDGFDQKKCFAMEYRLRRFDGEYRWVFDCGAPRFAADGTFLGYIGSCVDITERRQSEEALREAHEELSRLKNQLEAENIYLQQELHRDQSFGDIIGKSDAIKYVLFKINQVAPTDTTVLITGETGTGKELVAHAIHRASPRRDRALIKVNCAALSASLIESELFGHEKGAFTGAGARKMGRFELADGGTIFLDEIGELPLDLQSKLLRVIQEGELERVGGTKTLKVNVRIIAATNRNLKLDAERGAFRQDLWYRLNVFPITVPPLKQRKEDIPLMVEHFVNRLGKKFGKTIQSVSVSTMQRLQEHSWPGNVRELANVIERAVIHSNGTALNLVDSFDHVPQDDAQLQSKSLEEVERDYIVRILESTGWRIEGQYGAAKILGLNPSTLRTRMVKLGIQRSRATFASN